MSYKILKTNPRRNTHEFFVDTPNDIKNLPKEPASIATIATTGDTYICNNKKEWVKFNNCYCDGDSGESGGIIPTGTIFINENNIYDISEYAIAEVEVPNNEEQVKEITSYIYFNPSTVRDLTLKINNKNITFEDTNHPWVKSFTAPAGAIVNYTSSTNTDPPSLYVYPNDDYIIGNDGGYYGLVGVWEFNFNSYDIEDIHWFPALSHTLACFSSIS